MTSDEIKAERRRLLNELKQLRKSIYPQIDALQNALYVLHDKCSHDLIKFEEPGHNYDEIRGVECSICGYRRYTDD